MQLTATANLNSDNEMVNLSVLHLNPDQESPSSGDGVVGNANANANGAPYDMNIVYKPQASSDEALPPRQQQPAHDRDASQQQQPNAPRHRPKLAVLKLRAWDPAHPRSAHRFAVTSAVLVRGDGPASTRPSDGAGRGGATRGPPPSFRSSRVSHLSRVSEADDETADGDEDGGDDRAAFAAAASANFTKRATVKTGNLVANWGSDGEAEDGNDDDDETTNENEIRAGSYAGILLRLPNDHDPSPSASESDDRRIAWKVDDAILLQNRLRLVPRRDVARLARLVRSGEPSPRALIMDGLPPSSLSEADAKSLADALENNTGVRTLSARYSHLDDDAAVALARSLVRNKTITDISLEGNRLTNTAARSFFALIRQHNTALERLDLKNNPEIDEDILEAIDQFMKQRAFRKNLSKRKGHLEEEDGDSRDGSVAVLCRESIADGTFDPSATPSDADPDGPEAGAVAMPLPGETFARYVRRANAAPPSEKRPAPDRRRSDGDGGGDRTGSRANRTRFSAPRGIASGPRSLHRTRLDELKETAVRLHSDASGLADSAPANLTGGNTPYPTMQRQSSMRGLANSVIASNRLNGAASYYQQPLQQQKQHSMRGLANSVIASNRLNDAASYYQQPLQQQKQHSMRGLANSVIASNRLNDAASYYQQPLQQQKQHSMRGLANSVLASQKLQQWQQQHNEYAIPEEPAEPEESNSLPPLYKYPHGPMPSQVALNTSQQISSLASSRESSFSTRSSTQSQPHPNTSAVSSHKAGGSLSKRDYRRTAERTTDAVGAHHVAEPAPGRQSQGRRRTRQPMTQSQRMARLSEITAADGGRRESLVTEPSATNTEFLRGDTNSVSRNDTYDENDARGRREYEESVLAERQAKKKGLGGLLGLEDEEMRMDCFACTFITVMVIILLVMVVLYFL